MFIRVVLVTTFLAYMSAAYATPADRPLSPFDSLHLVFRARTPTFGVSLRRRTSVPLSDFPVQCQQGCVPAINAINTCTSSSCVCDPTVDSSLAYCVSCSVNADPTPSIIQSGQQLLDTYNNLCKGTGVSTISFAITNTAPAPAAPPGTSTSVTTVKPISTTTRNVIPTPALGPTTTISALPQTGTSTITPIASTSATASSQRNNAPVIRPRSAFMSIGLAMAISIVIL